MTTSLTTTNSQLGKNNRPKGNIFQDKNILIAVSITAIAIMPLFSVSPILPTIAKGLNISAQQAGLIMAAYLIPVALGTPIFGLLADHFGFKKVLIPSLLVFTLGGILCAFAGNFRSLIEWRILQGIGAAPLEALTLSIISSLYGDKKLTQAMAVNAGAIGVGSTIYPILGGVLASLSWRYPFALSLLAVPVALLVMLKLKLPRTPKNTEKFQLGSYVKNILKSIQNRNVLALFFAVITLFMVEFGAFYTFTPIFAGDKLGATSAVIGIILTTNAISLTIFSIFVTLAANKVSEIKLIKISFVIFAIALCIIPTVNSIPMLVIPCVLMGIVEALAFPSLQSSLAKLAPIEYRAGFMSLNVTIQAVGRAIGPVFAGILFGIWGIQGVCYVGAAVTAIALVGFSLLINSKSRKV
ncbi:MFS transporter [Rivularia sp. UHCC 0363]|uniref:MFS transporter n=1 Tax=Rivularia sp. UHCC 0363 TaxID=3110244 RepID=UPI002B201D21|nr:MFS transporter [Rivularia sp. UHCC 0363]MEA5595610.1 MFS transporter [Rivularia sp. UHCC 0363]